MAYAEPDFSTIERFLLMSALAHDVNASRGYGNGGRVVEPAMRWAGLLNAEVEAAWKRGERHPAVDDTYRELIRMTRRHVWKNPVGPERGGEALFEGMGNLGTPEAPGADPEYVSVWLTYFGIAVARKLLAQRPDLKKEGRLACFRYRIRQMRAAAWLKAEEAKFGATR